MSEDEIVEGMVSQAMSQGDEGPSSEEEIVTKPVDQLLRDENVLRQICEDKPEYKALLAALSHLNRTSNTDSKTADLWRRYFKRAVDLVLMTKKEEDIDLGEVAFLDSLYIFAMCASEDAVSGWRGRLVTEIRRIFRVERGQSASKRRWFW